MIFQNKNILITGIANRKSIAYLVAKDLEKRGAKLFLTFQNEEIQSKMKSYFSTAEFFILNVVDEKSIQDLKANLCNNKITLHGFLHSIAFANYSEGMKPFHETKLKDYLEASQISAFSLVQICNELKNIFDTKASVVTVSISNNRATNYGYMGPIKASLDAMVAYLAKSFSQFSEIRFNSVNSGPLKTSASAGIPGYIENYLYAEQLTMRHRALETSEVSNTIVFLLSDYSSGINASNLLVDAGMSANYFDEQAVMKFNKN